MDAKDLAFDYGSDSEEIKDFATILPGVCVSVLADSLIVESVYSCDLPSLMVATEESDVSWIFKFQTKQ